MPKNNDPISLNIAESGDATWSAKMPMSMFSGEFTEAQVAIYSALDFLAGKRGWWYGEQDEIILYAERRLHQLGIPTKMQNYSASTFRRAIKLLRIKGLIVTENMGLKMNGILKYYVIARKPQLPPRNMRT